MVPKLERLTKLLPNEKLDIITVMMIVLVTLAGIMMLVKNKNTQARKYQI